MSVESDVNNFITQLDQSPRSKKPRTSSLAIENKTHRKLPLSPLSSKYYFVIDENIIHFYFIKLNKIYIKKMNVIFYLQINHRQKL